MPASAGTGASINILGLLEIFRVRPNIENVAAASLSPHTHGTL
jgi:hypothetical protein